MMAMCMYYTLHAGVFILFINNTKNIVVEICERRVFTVPVLLKYFIGIDQSTLIVYY